MPSLSFFMDRYDIPLLLDRMNTDPEIAFIVSDSQLGNETTLQRRGPAFLVEDGEFTREIELSRRWKAVRTVNALTDGLQSLWHVPAGSLPLVEVPRNPGPMSLIGPTRPSSLCCDSGSVEWMGWNRSVWFWMCLLDSSCSLDSTPTIYGTGPKDTPGAQCILGGQR